jgi:hypothetical protein
MQNHKQIITSVFITITIGFNFLLLSSSHWILVAGNVDGIQNNLIEARGNTKLVIIDNKNSTPYHLSNLNLTGITSLLPDEEEEKRSDLFYYILGIIILIVSAFILRQRYKQYLEEKNKLNR